MHQWRIYALRGELDSRNFLWQLLEAEHPEMFTKTAQEVICLDDQTLILFPKSGTGNFQARIKEHIRSNTHKQSAGKATRVLLLSLNPKQLQTRAD